MTPEDRRTVLLVLAFSISSMIWSWYASRPYWFILSGIALVWSIDVARGGRVNNPAAALFVIALLALVPAAGILMGRPSGEFLEVLFSPALIFSLSLWIISSTLLLDGGYSPGTLAFLTFMLAVSTGTLVLLALYYIDASIFTDLIPSNSAMMWPLSSLLFGSLAISLTLRVSGMEEAALGSREAES